jgi:cytochrome c
MKRFVLTAAAAVLTLAALAPMAAHADDGKKVFNKCKACHTAEDQKNKVGPYLGGVVGRKAGSVEGFKYSDAMKDSALTWDEETLDKFLTKPKDLVPGTKMSFAGLRKEEDRKALIEYLKSNHD